MRPIGGQYDDFDLVISSGQIEGIVELVEHFFVLRIAHVYAIKGNTRNGVIYFILNCRKL